MRKLTPWVDKYIVSLLQRVHHICTAKRHQVQNKKKDIMCVNVHKFIITAFLNVILKKF